MQRTQNKFFLFTFLFTLIIPCLAAQEESDVPFDLIRGAATVPSSIQSIQPVSCIPGNRIQFVIKGKNLISPEFFFDDAIISVDIVSNTVHPVPPFQKTEGRLTAEIMDTASPHTLTVNVLVSKEAKVGLHSLRIRTPYGMTNPVSFYVDKEVPYAETENNNRFLKANDVSLPVVISGKINHSGDVDCFSFDAAAGEEWVFQVRTGGLKSSLKSTLKLLDNNGKLLMESDHSESNQNALMGYKFETDGQYTIQIQDRYMRGGGAYRLYIDRFTLITRVSQLGIEQGNSSKIALEGFNLNTGKSVEMQAQSEALPWTRLLVRIPKESGLNPPALAVLPHTVVLEDQSNQSIQTAQELLFPGAVSGDLASGVEDCFLFEAEKDRRMVIEILAQRLGSPLDSVIEILDKNGNSIERLRLRCVSQTNIHFRPPDSKSGSLRIRSFADMEINDYLLLGQEIIKIRTLPDNQDEDITLHSLKGQRQCYFGSSSVHHALGDALYRVEAHPPYTKFPSNNMPVHPVFWRNDDGGQPFHHKDSKLLFEAPYTGKYFIRVSDSLGRTGVEYQYLLNIRRERKDFTISASPSYPNIPLNHSIPITVNAAKYDNYDAPIHVKIEDLPDGFSADEGVIIAGETGVTIALHAESHARSFPPEQSFTVKATSILEGKEFVKTAKVKGVSVRAKPDIILTLDQDVLEIPAGGKKYLTVYVKRQNGFNSRVPLRVNNLPHGVFVRNIGLNGILIDPQDVERVLTLSAEPWVKPQELTIYVTGFMEHQSPVRSSHISRLVRLRILAPDGSVDRDNYARR